MGDGTDEQVLDEFFQAVTPTIEDMVTQAVRQGQRLLGLAVVVERKFDGEVTGGVALGARSAGVFEGSAGSMTSLVRGSSAW
jgi:hypothetical protein